MGREGQCHTLCMTHVICMYQVKEAKKGIHCATSMVSGLWRKEGHTLCHTHDIRIRSKGQGRGCHTVPHPWYQIKGARKAMSHCATSMNQVKRAKKGMSHSATPMVSGHSCKEGDVTLCQTHDIRSQGQGRGFHSVTPILLTRLLSMQIFLHQDFCK